MTKATMNWRTSGLQTTKILGTLTLHAKRRTPRRKNNNNNNNNYIIRALEL